MKKTTRKKTTRKKTSSRRALRPKVAKKTVLFEFFDPSATVVAVAGDFNKWSATNRPLKRDAGGLWTVRVRLVPGRYQYKFVVNGNRWEEDPLNLDRVMNEHGTYNSIRKVGASPDNTAGSP